MEKLIILRLFLYFPLIGFGLPDLGFLLSAKAGNIPLAHILVEAVLITVVAVCTYFITVSKRKQDTLKNSQPAV